MNKKELLLNVGTKKNIIFERYLIKKMDLSGFWIRFIYQKEAFLYGTKGVEFIRVKFFKQL